MLYVKDEQIQCMDKQKIVPVAIQAYFNITNLKDSSIQAELGDNIIIILYILTISGGPSVEVGIVVAGVTIIKRKQMHVNEATFVF